ncbi:ribonuclease HI, partial [Trypanosoma cruzi]
RRMLSRRLISMHSTMSVQNCRCTDRPARISVKRRCQIRSLLRAARRDWLCVATSGVFTSVVDPRDNQPLQGQEQRTGFRPAASRACAAVVTYFLYYLRGMQG